MMKNICIKYDVKIIKSKPKPNKMKNKINQNKSMNKRLNKKARENGLHAEEKRKIK